MIRRSVLAALALSALALAACEGEKGMPAALQPQKSLTVETRSGESHAFTVELAITEAEQAAGLTHRTRLAPDAGMLFYLGPREVEAAFWMKDTPLSLDVLYLRANGVISRIYANAAPNDPTEMLSNGPVMGVLEIPGGRAHELGIKAGDRIRHPLFGG